MSDSSQTLPRVSVIMPVRNEQSFIARSLGTVIEQDYPAELVEIIVADGMSTDGTREMVQQMGCQCPRVHLVDNHGGIVPTGMNAAMAQATGEVIVRIDGHCEIARDYVRRCVEHLEQDGVDGVGGPIETIGQTGMARAIAVAMSSPFGVGGSAFRTVKGRTLLVDTVAFPAYTRAAIELAGPYDEELVRNQDDEYNYRLRKRGARILLADDVRSTYYSRGSLRKLGSQFFQYGFWKVRVMQKHPRQMRTRQFVPAAFMVSLLLSVALVPFLDAGLWLLGMVLGSYLLANLAATFATARRHGWRLLCLLPVIFAVMHFAYGSGFLVGMIRFCGRWGDSTTRAHSVCADSATAPVHAQTTS